MERTAEHQPIFGPTDTGILVQAGTTSSFSAQDSTSYLTIKNRALDVQTLFERNGFSIQKSPTIHKLVVDASELSDAWLCNQLDQVSLGHLLSAAQIDRIATAILPLGFSSSAKNILSDMLTGSSDLLDRQQSKAKDTLWELELLHTLRTNSINADIGEPDLIITLNGPSIGVACKKLYSESNVSKVLSQAVAQIEKGFDFGIVALNIDDLLPPNALLKAPTLEKMSATLTGRIDDFLSTHERHLRRYLEPGRAMSALISCAAIADVTSHKNRFLNARQSTIWHIPGLPPEKERQMDNFYAALNSSYPAST
jgi:hypothetical protein